MLKAIGSAAREQIQKINCWEGISELFVKVQPKWRQSRLRLAELGYRVKNEAQGLLRKFCKSVSVRQTATPCLRLKRAFSGWSLRRHLCLRRTSVRNLSRC